MSRLKVFSATTIAASLLLLMAATASSVSATGIYVFSGRAMIPGTTLTIAISGSGTWSDTGSATGILRWTLSGAGSQSGGFTCTLSINNGGMGRLELGGRVTTSTLDSAGVGEACTIVIIEGPTSRNGTIVYDNQAPITWAAILIGLANGTLLFTGNSNVLIR